MRDIKRIAKFLVKLNTLWQMFPDMRFWQIVSLITEDAIFMNMKDPFFLEDDKWMTAIDNTIKKYETKIK